MSQKILILGAGKIGRAIVQNLRRDFKITVGDTSWAALESIPDYDIQKGLINPNGSDTWDEIIGDNDIVISALYCTNNLEIARACLRQDASYFDLSEDVETAESIADIVRKAKPEALFVPQCGLAPGFVSIAASNLIAQFDSVDNVEIRVGALPQNPKNALKYSLTWSTDGLINEYCNEGQAIKNGKQIRTLPLGELEELYALEQLYEAFNTSGGLGSLWAMDLKGARNVNYKTLRYPGHCEKMRFLLVDCDFQNHRPELKALLEATIPYNGQDKVVIHITVDGQINNRYVSRDYVREIVSFNDMTAIQLTTANAVCAVVTMYVAGLIGRKGGLLYHHDIPMHTFIQNGFGNVYA